ncbi:hypothetical protein ES332_A08G092500v1 [Gossypium tomentosum]|uniref:DEAD-box RNA helicase Q domain-containing protein n=1 Tax=Gossypium tomentosum TaxID=34277 RepID=A0A5D2PF84_GOSTO|nr:hypothetical protein ES332_A08G092500v1 [Gossypium tomentosum]
MASVLYTYRSCVEALPQGYVGIHSSGFRNFLLKPELLRSIVDSGFEHPFELRQNFKLMSDVNIREFHELSHFVFLAFSDL